MIAFLEIALSNIAMAAVLAIPATLATLWGRRPALAYGLWLRNDRLWRTRRRPAAVA